MKNTDDEDRRDAIRDQAERVAREEDRSIARLTAALRLASFRAYLATAVDMMPTILPDVSTGVGLPLSEGLQRLRPYDFWPARAGGGFAKSLPTRLPSFAALGRRFPAGDVYAHVGRFAAALLSDGALADWTEIVVCGRWLEITMRTAFFELATHEGMAQLKVPGRMPDTVLAACAGRSLDDIVDHALLRDRSLVVDSARLLGNQTILQFRIGGSRVAYPWRA